MVRRLVGLLRAKKCSYIVTGRKGVHAFARHKMTSLCSLLAQRPRFLGKTLVTSGMIKGKTTTLVVLNNVGRLCASIIDSGTVSLFRASSMGMSFMRRIPFV